MFLTFKSVDETVTIQMKAIEQYFHVVLFVFPISNFSILSLDSWSERVKNELHVHL